MSFHGRFDEFAYGVELYEGEVIQGDGITLMVKDGRTGPGASFGGWTLDERLVESPRVSDLHPMLESIPDDVVLRLAAPTYYPERFWHGFCAAAAYGGWKFTPDVVMVCDTGWRLRRSKAEDVRYGFRDGATVVPIASEQAMAFLGEEKDRKGYPWTYDTDRYVEQTVRWPDFMQHGVMLEGELVAALLTVQVGQTVTMTAGHQSARGREVHSFEVLMVTQTKEAFAAGARFVDLGPIGQRFANLVTYKEGFGARPYVRWNLSR